VSCALLRGCQEGRLRRGGKRVVSVFCTSGSSLTAEYEREREAASEGLDFRARRGCPPPYRKAGEAFTRLPELARQLDDLNAVILQRAAEKNDCRVF